MLKKQEQIRVQEQQQQQQQAQQANAHQQKLQDAKNLAHRAAMSPLMGQNLPSGLGPVPLHHSKSAGANMMMRGGQQGIAPPGGPHLTMHEAPELGVAHRMKAPNALGNKVITPSYMKDLSFLDSSLRQMPEAMDTERPKQYVPGNPYRTPACFPDLPAPIFDDPNIFAKFDTDTLFFIFYFQQGTQHQYLAARELKKQSWRYHKKFLTWFQRHNDPKFKNEECEQGTYVFFDYESGWCKRIKSDFTFEYCHLEDELRI